MKFGIRNLFLICFVISVLQIHSCNSEDEEDDEDRPRSCQKYIYDFVYSIAKNLLKCLGGQSTFKVNNIFEYVTRNGCLLKCVIQGDGVIGEDGRLDDIAAAFYFEETFAPEVQQTSLPIAQGCFALANDFNPKEYWCKTYIPFIECTFGAILKGLIPYGGDCITNPLLGILFSVFKYVTPDSPKIADEMEELRRAVGKTNPVKCFDKNCTKMYEYKKVNGSNSIVLYNKDMEVISIENRKTKPKPNANNDVSYKNYNNNNNNVYGYSYNR